MSSFNDDRLLSMRKRPEISAEVKREVRFECGDRCAVDGCQAGLEFAHIRAWSKSKDNSAENLVYLCANCHARADREKWTEDHLRMYKDKPWIHRIQWEHPPGPKFEVTLTVKVNVHDLKGVDVKTHVKTALAGFLEELTPFAQLPDNDEKDHHTT